MKFLIDTGPKIHGLVRQYDIVLGQLLTPGTSYTYLGYPYGIDNSAFSKFNPGRFRKLLKRQRDDKDKCLFVSCPDVVGSARRTLEAFDHWFPSLEGWPVALVAQDGLEDLPIPWKLISGIFIGGSTEWKMSQCATDVIKAAVVCEKYIHVGRVNTPKRFKHFADLGADSCDGSGVSRFDWMLEKIVASQFDDHPLWDGCNGVETGLAVRT